MARTILHGQSRRRIWYQRRQVNIHGPVPMPNTYSVTVNVHTSLLTPNSGPICSYVLAQMDESLVTHAVQTASTIVITLRISSCPVDVD